MKSMMAAAGSLRMLRLFGIVLLAVGPAAWATESMELGLEQPQRTRIADPASLVADFAMTNHEGRTARFSELRSRPTLVFFGFTNCASVCPTAMQQLRQVRRALENTESPPNVALISVDGERDTPEALKAFLQPFGEGFVGFTGPPADVRPVADGFRAIFFKGGPTDTPRGYDVEHTSQTYLVDADGRLRATFYSAPVADMVAVTRYLSQ